MHTFHFRDFMDGHSLHDVSERLRLSRRGKHFRQADTGQQKAVHPFHFKDLLAGHRLHDVSERLRLNELGRLFQQESTSDILVLCVFLAIVLFIVRMFLMIMQ